MTIADEFRGILAHETTLSIHTIETATFPELARHMHTELGEDRLKRLGVWNSVRAYVTELDRAA